MRLWHYKIVDLLPSKFLCGQWRECAAIAGILDTHGKTNHYIINRLMDYPDIHIRTYFNLIYEEMVKRGFKTSKEVVKRLKIEDIKFTKEAYNVICSDGIKLFDNFHNKRHLIQTLYIFQERYDCGGLDEQTWYKMVERFNLIDR